MYYLNNKLILISCLVISAVVIGIKYFQRAAISFEYICPDSSGYKPVFVNALDNDYGKILREKYNLDAFVAQSKNELDLVLLVTDWVHHLWEHNGDAIPTKSDPLFILSEVIDHLKQFRCTEYALVLAACLNAIGITTRIVSLARADVETAQTGAGHVINEAYLKSLNKWVMIDSQANVIPAIEQMPLNAVELQKALSGNKFAVQILSVHPEVTMQQYADFIGQYLYYFRTKLTMRYEYRVDEPSIMLVPLSAKKPEIFQQTQPFTNVSYTHSVPCFYSQR